MNFDTFNETKLTMDEVRNTFRELSRLFGIVRLVDVTESTQFSFDLNGNLVKKPFTCYAVWNKTSRCENCISAKAFKNKGQLAKFEFVNSEVYYVISKYIEVDGTPYMLEAVSRVNDDTLFGAYGKSEFIDTITAFNNNLYIDPVTGVYNRRYYSEQLYGLSAVDAVAMVDVDNFKEVNDSFGHPIGDTALRAVADVLQRYSRSEDSVVRYGGDEFFMLFRHIPKKAFRDRLELIRRKVSALTFEENPAIKITVSIGGLYCTTSATEALHTADRLLYKAKLKRDSIEFFEKE